MSMFLILAPYLVLNVLLFATSATTSLFAAAGICLVGIATDVVRGRSIKILGAGTAVLFAGLGLYLLAWHPTLSNSAVRLAVDAGMLTISLGSMLLRRPFTLQYAVEAVPPEIAAMPGFLRASYLITGAWTAAMLLMLASNVAMLYVPGLPFWTGLAIAFAARNSALYFTKWYPEYRRIKYGDAPAVRPLSGQTI
jgi:hypothetical protein